MEGKKTPGEKMIKQMSLKTKMRISMSSSFILFALGLLFFCESFFRLRTGSDQPTWIFSLIMSTLVIFISLTLFSNAMSFKSKLSTKKILKKNGKKKLAAESGKLEIQKSPQK